MRINGITICGFRGLQEIYIPQLDEHVNVFVGINGAGKSSILDAMSLVFSWFTARMLSAKGRGKDIPRDDISHRTSNGCSISLDMGQEKEWKLYRSLKYHKSDKSDLSAMNQLISKLREEFDNDSKINIPMIVHYGVDRVIPAKYPRLPKNKSSFSPLEAYKNSLNGGLAFSDFFNWFRLTEDYENERFKSDSLYEDRELQVVRESLNMIMPEYTDIKVTRRPLALTMKKNGETFKFNQLSDGEKCYIALVCDIARRLAVANPDGKPRLGHGIILIDEIELHLHPKWQQSIVSKLVSTFPNCQFFITTHSPIVASDVNGKVFGIKNGEVVPQQTFGKLSSNILSSVFDVSMARSLYVQSIFDSAYEALRQNNHKVYTDNYESLVKILGCDDSDVVSLRIEKMRRDKLMKA